MLKKILTMFNAPSPIAERGVILHGHMFKNAGSTLDWSLRRNFHKNFCDHRDDRSMRSGGANYLLDYLKNNANCQAISSHHLCMPLPEKSNFNLYPLFLIRHPIVRVRSVYDFERKQPEFTPGSIHAKKYSFIEYVKWRMRPDVNPTIRDYQLRYCLSKAYENKSIDIETYNLAINKLAKNTVMGVVDRYDESMVVFEDKLRPAFPNINLAYVIQNEGRKSKVEESVAVKAEKIITELGICSKQLIEQNQMDLKLYTYANKRLDQMIMDIDDFDKKYLDFKSRCSLLSKTAIS